MTKNRLNVVRLLPALALALLPAARAQQPARTPSANAAQKTPARAADTTADVSAAIGRAFGTGAEAVTGFKPFFLSGDFNADGAQDLLAVVRLKSGRKGLPAGVRVLNPFGYDAGGDAGALALAVLHGGAGGWRAGVEPAAKFLLLGGSPVLVLNEGRLAEPDAVKNLMEVVARTDAKKRRGLAHMKMPASARGDWVLVGTEATEALIYWDGKTYRFREDPEGY